MGSDLSGKAAVVTGSSRGIGRAIAIGLAARGAAVTSFGRVGQPEDVADVAVFLASDEARWVTGQNIAAGGGVF